MNAVAFVILLIEEHQGALPSYLEATPSEDCQGPMTAEFPSSLKSSLAKKPPGSPTSSLGVFRMGRAAKIKRMGK